MNDRFSSLLIFDIYDIDLEQPKIGHLEKTVY